MASDYGVDGGGGLIPAGGRSRRRHLVIAALALALAGFVLAMGISARVINEPAVRQQRQALSERIASATAEQQDVAVVVEGLREKERVASAESLAISAAGRLISEQIATLELVTGYTAVHGPGLVVTMQDAEPRDDVDPDLAKVLDSDIQEAVNGLWEAGAEAIAINSQRLTARSAIRSAAGAVLVNYRPLRPPYRIEAIGDSTQMRVQFAKTQSAATLRQTSKQFGIGFSTAVGQDLVLPAATGPLPSRATVVTQGEEAAQ